MRKFRKIASCLLTAVMLAGTMTPVEDINAASYWQSAETSIVRYGTGNDTAAGVIGGGQTSTETTTATTETATQTPTTEKPAAETPTTEKTTTETPTTEKPAAQTPTTEKPAAETPTTEKPAAETPTTEKPAAETPTTEIPTTATPTTETPTTEQPQSIYTNTGLSPLTSKVIVIDPGHCNKHPGAKGNGLKEQNVNLDISLAFRDYLDLYGDVTVYMTREDGSCCADLGVGECLAGRNNYAKRLDADFLISVHINAGSSNGANVLAAYNSGFHDSIRKETQAFGKIALSRLKEIGIANRGLLLRKSGSGNRYSNGRLADYYSIVRRGVVQNIPSVIIEHGYITSSSDCNKFFKTNAKRTQVGQADAKAVIDYYNLNKKVIEGNFSQENNETYFVAADNKKMAGWVKDDGKWYYFDTMSGKMQKGFITLDGQTFYLSPNTGEMIVGWFVVDGKQYLAKGNGTIVKNQVYSDGQYSYIFDNNGQIAKKGFYTMDGAKYYVNSKKRIATGLTKVGSATYYFNTTTGKMETGWKKISKKYYYFSKTTGKMQKSKWIGRYYVNSKGIRTKKK